MASRKGSRGHGTANREDGRFLGAETTVERATSISAAKKRRMHMAPTLRFPSESPVKSYAVCRFTALDLPRLSFSSS